jgi:hypothetical protein
MDQLNGAPQPDSTAAQAPPPAPAEAPTPAPREYPLSPIERATLQNLNFGVLAAKARVFDLQVQLDAAAKQVDRAQTAFDANSTLVMTSRHLSNCQYVNNFEKMIVK